MQETESTVPGLKYSKETLRNAVNVWSAGTLVWKERLANNAQALTCSLTPKDCSDLLAYIKAIELISSHQTFLLLERKSKSKAASKPKKKRTTKRKTNR